MLDGDAGGGAGRVGPNAGAGADIPGDSRDHPDTPQTGRVYGALRQGGLLSLESFCCIRFVYIFGIDAVYLINPSEECPNDC